MNTNPAPAQYGQIVLQFIRDLGYDPYYVVDVHINHNSVIVEQVPRPYRPFRETNTIQIDTREKVAA